MVRERTAFQPQLPRVLHSDKKCDITGNASESRCYTLFNRQRTSNDNAFAESVFRTLKYGVKYPTSGFKSLEEAQDWVLAFTRWYNNEHLHSGLNFVTP